MIQIALLQIIRGEVFSLSPQQTAIHQINLLTIFINLSANKMVLTTIQHV